MTATYYTHTPPPPRITDSQLEYLCRQLNSATGKNYAIIHERGAFGGRVGLFLLTANYDGTFTTIADYGTTRRAILLILYALINANEAAK